MGTVSADWFLIAGTEGANTPALVIYPQRVQHNIELVKNLIGDLSRLRPHVKTHKSSNVTQMLLKEGVTKFKCATIAEAEMLAMNLAPDVLLAYQPVGVNIRRLVQLIKTYPATVFSCLADNCDSARLLASQAAANSITVNVYIDLNVGMNRTGITPGQPAVQLYQYCLMLPGIKPIGLHAYDGHIHQQDLKVRQQQAFLVLKQIEDVTQQLLALKIPAPVIVVGGTPTFSIYAANHKVECSPGTFVFWDAGYRTLFAEQGFQIAALVITRIVSMPSANLICLDLGHKAIAAENTLDKRVVLLNMPGAKIISQSEEHLVVDAGERHNCQIGDVIYAAPYHICPTVALYDEALTIVDSHIAGIWPVTARKRKINI